MRYIILTIASIVVLILLVAFFPDMERAVRVHPKSGVPSLIEGKHDIKDDFIGVKKEPETFFSKNK
jgi:hypothetical protein